ncbi:MAG: hypothetical protein ACREN8_14005, partial [Candidatus Dormibacteraceae bacterium]
MVIKYKILPVLAVGLIAAIALPEAASAEGTVPALNTCASTQAAVSGAPSLDAQLLPTAPADMSEFASQGEFGIQQVAKLAALPDLESGMEAALDADDQTDLSENDELATVADALDPSANQAFTSAQQAAVTTFALQNANADPAAVNAAVKAGYSAAVDEVITGDQPIANNVVDQPDATTLDPVSAPSSTLCLANDLADRPVNTALAQDLQLGNQINQDLSPEAENVADARLVAPPAGDISRTDIKIDRSGIAKENAADDANQAAKHASDEAAKRNADPVAKAAPPAKQAAIARPTKAVLPKQAATIAKKRKLQQPQRRAVTRTRVQGQCSRVRT